MKCISCKEKFPKKHVHRCAKLPTKICLKCAIEGVGSHSCDLNCPDSKFPSLTTYPLSSSIVGMTPMGEIKGTTEEFMPRGFHFLSCKVSKLKISLIKVNLIEVEVTFILKGNKTIPESIYFGEKWKLHHLDNLLKEAQRKVTYAMGPIFTTFTHAGLRVIPESIRLEIENKNILIFVNDTAELIGLPDCFPPLTDNPKPSNEKHTFFSAKSAVFYSPLLLNREYKINYKIEAINYYYELGFLFPYRYVTIENLNINSQTSFELAGRKIRLMEPFRRDKFPKRQEYEWYRHKHIPSNLPPAIISADPFRNQSMLGESFKSERTISESENLNITLRDYSALQTLFLLKKSNSLELISIVDITDSPIPVRIYEQLQALPKYRDFLISFDIFNISEKQLDLELSSKIKGYTDTAITNVTLPPYGPNTSKHLLIPQVPKLKRGILSKISNSTSATLEFKIIKKIGSRRIIIERGTKIIKLLPQDLFIRSIKDPKTSNLYDLSKMLGAWITPSDSQGLLDKTRAEAANFHPEGILEGEQGNTTLENKSTQIKAIFDYLNKKVKIKYVNQPFTFDFKAGGQRIITPEKVLKIKAGNCIDLVILFSSLMEGLGITPLIFIMPGHAFLGWGNKYKTSEMGFLECTCLGMLDPQTGQKYTFEKAFDIAKRNFIKEFLYKGEENYLPIHSISIPSNKGYIVDLDEIRKEGIFRTN